MDLKKLSELDMEKLSQMIKQIDPVFLPGWVKLIAVIVEIIVLSIVAYFIFVIPLLNKIYSLDSSRDSLIETYIAQKREGQSLVRSEQYLSFLKDKYQKAILLSPKKSEIEFILREINHIGIKNKIVFNSFKPETEVMEGVYIMLPIVVSMSGKFEDFSKFCYELTKLSRLISIEDVDIKKDDGDDASASMLKFSFIVKVYRYQKNSAGQD